MSIRLVYVRISLVGMGNRNVRNSTLNHSSCISAQTDVVGKQIGNSCDDLHIFM